MKYFPWEGQFPRRQSSQGTEHTGRLCKQSGSSPEAKPSQNRILSQLIFSSPCPCCPELKQVCCCLHNLGEETEPLSAETSGAKACGWTDTPSWLSVPWSPHGPGLHGKFGVRNSQLAADALLTAPIRHAPASQGSDQTYTAG